MNVQEQSPEISGTWLPYTGEPKLFRADARHANAQAKYLDAFQMIVEQPESPPVNHLLHRTDLLLKSGRSVARAILDVPVIDAEHAIYELSSFVIAEDTRRDESDS